MAAPAGSFRISSEHMMEQQFRAKPPVANPSCQKWSRRRACRDQGPPHTSPIFLGDPDCTARIPCYTAASRLPALVRRSELQETAMSDDKNKPASGFQFGLTNLKPVESSKIALTFPDGAKREFTKRDR